MKALIKWFFGGSSERKDLSCTTSTTAVGFSGETKLSFDETIALMSRGYENSQRVIQFMDAKAGAVVALGLVLYAFVGKLVAWAYSQTDVTVIQSYPEWIKVSVVAVGGISLVFGFLALTFSFKTVRPNHLPDWEAFSALFPAHAAIEDPRARAYLQNVTSGADCQFAIREFECQLLAVGKLVFRKINWLRIAVGFLWLQGFSAVLFGGVIACIALSGKLVKSEKPVAPVVVQLSTPAPAPAPAK